MRLPVIRGAIKRRLLINFRADPDVARRLLPDPFRPKLREGSAIVGICLIRLESLRPAGLPALVGLSSENAAHRFAVEWTNPEGNTEEGVWIPRRDTDSRFNTWAGGRIFPGEHHHATFEVHDEGGRIDLRMAADDGSASVHVIGETASSLPADSCFSALEQASAFFEGGSLGYSATRDAFRFDGLLLKTDQWRVEPLAITRVHSSFFDDSARFPPGAIHFDHALIMRNVPHEWHAAPDLRGKFQNRNTHTPGLSL